MHIRKIARELWITTQDLKQELISVNFWVDPNENEVPDHLASWILRVLWRKFKWNKKSKVVNEIEKPAPVSNVEKPEKSKEIVKDTETEEKPQKKSIRERRLEQEKIKQDLALEKEKSDRKKQTEKKLEDEFKSLNKKKFSAKWENIKWKKQEKRFGQDKSKDWMIAVTRKIQIWKDDYPESKKKSKKKWHHEEQEQKASKKLKFNELSKEEIDLMSEEERIEYFADLEESKRLDDEMFKTQQQKKKKVIKAFSNQEQIKEKQWIVELPDIVTIKEYSEKIWVPVSKVIAALMKNWMMMTINQSIDFDTASLLASDFDVEVIKSIVSASAEELIEWDLSKLIKDEKENLIGRPPVVVVMWHVDHWKTSILDYFRKTNIISKEAWWITQHIWAYQIDSKKRKISFLDTPWHEAFTAMRARWAKVTDIAILVVAADDWVKPQTVEAYNHAKEAWVSIVVAINKTDVQWANIDKVKWELAEIWLMVEDWWWEIPCVWVSAKHWQWMDDLLDTVFLLSDMLELKANPNRKAIWTVVESHLDKSHWPVATVLINTWTLKKKDIFIAWTTMWRVKSMIDSIWKSKNSLDPSWVSQISGFEEVPNVWDILQVVSNEKEARERTEKIKLIHEQSSNKWVWIEEIQRRIAAWKMNLLKIIIKSDTQWSLEAITNSLVKIYNDEVWVKIIHSWVWSITDSDILMSTASNALVIWFHISIAQQTRLLADKEWVEIQEFKVIYEIENAIKALLTWMLKTEEVEVEAWEVVVEQIFYTKKKMMIVGWKVEKWFVRKWAKVIVERKWEEIDSAQITNLKFFKDDAEEVKKWNECWMQFNKKIDIEKWDILKIFVIEKKIKSLD